MAKLPTVVSNISPDLRAFVNRVREAIEGKGGNKFVTVDDLILGGIAAPGPGGTITPPTGGGVITTPPAPTNVAANGALQNIIVSWDAPNYFGHAYAEVWGSSTDVLGDAVMLGMTPGSIYVDDVGPSVTRYYWVRFVNTQDTAGAFNAVDGTEGVTGPAVDYLLTQLAGSITSSELAAALNSRIDLIDGSVATPGTIPNQLAFLQGQVDAITSYPDYDNATTYAADDIVKYDGGLYKAISATTGNLPTNATYWLKIGDYSSIADVVAAHTAEIAVLTTDLGGEVTARESLATQMRGAYTGTDLASVTTGLIFSERTARTTADTGLASSISAVSATAASKNRIYRQTTAPASPQVNDIWVDTKPNYAIPYFADDYSTPKYNQYQWDGSSWQDITNTDITDNFALIVTEQTARATADAAFAESITTLETSVNDPVTGLVATRATLINDYSTSSTVTTAIANSKTTLRAYTDVSASRTFRQVSAPTKRGVDADTSSDIPLQTGDVWIDIDDQNKLYQWSGSAWVYSPDGAITGSISSLTATLTNDYLTQTDTENAIAQSSTFLRAYADIQSKVFRQADAPTKRGVDPETAADVALEAGDVWYDTNDGNKLYLWSGSAWVYSPDADITGSVTAVDARVTTVETTQIGYCTIGGLASDDTNRADCEAAGGTWNVGIPIATAVKQVSISDGADSATLETRATAQKTLNDGLKAQYTIKLDVNGNVAGYGVFADSTGSSEFIANVNRFAVTTPQTSIQLRANSTTYAVGAIARVAGADSKTLVCKVGGTTGSSTPTIGDIGAVVTDGSVRWQIASRVPFAVQAVPTNINGQPVPAGVYIDAAYVLNATIQNAQIADLAVDDNKIASLDVGKLTAGSIDVGQYIQSTNYDGALGTVGTQGWIIRGNGYAEFGAASIRGTLTAAQINTNGLSIRDTAGNIILNAGTGDFTGTVAGTAASTVVNNASSALATATSASSTATSANNTANAAIDALGTKLDNDARNVLSGSGGIALGSLSWDSNGIRTSGYGVGLTRAGFAAFNSSGTPTFVLAASDGSATFSGDIVAGTLGGSLVGATVVRSANYSEGSAGWQIVNDGNAEFNQITVRSGQVTGALLRAVKINSYSGIFVHIEEGTPVSTTNGPYQLNGSSPPQYLVGTFTMPAPETAAHRIAAVINVQALGHSSTEDLAVLLIANANFVGSAVYGEQVAYNTNSGTFGIATNGAGITTGLYGTATTFAVFVGGYNAFYTVQTIDGLLFGVR